MLTSQVEAISGNAKCLQTVYCGCSSHDFGPWIALWYWNLCLPWHGYHKLCLVHPCVLNIYSCTVEYAGCIHKIGRPKFLHYILLFAIKRCSPFWAALLIASSDRRLFTVVIWSKYYWNRNMVTTQFGDWKQEIVLSSFPWLPYCKRDSDAVGAMIRA